MAQVCKNVRYLRRFCAQNTVLRRRLTQEKTHLRQSLDAIPLYTYRPGTKTGSYVPEMVLTVCPGTKTGSCVPGAILTGRPGTKTGGRQLIVIQKDAEFKMQIPAL